MSKFNLSLLVILLILAAGFSACGLNNYLTEDNAFAISKEAVNKETLLVGEDNPAQQGQTEVQAIELQQIVLPDGHSEFPMDTVWVVVPGEPTYFEVPIPLNIPASWDGKYVVNQIGNISRYLYIENPDMQEAIFSIAALTEVEWQAIQSEPHGEALLSYSGIVWVYNPALENPYTGENAETFSRMVGEAYDVSHSLSSYFTPVINAETTLPVLQAYFDSLSAGNYPEAAHMFGGDIGVLVGNNPDIKPEDRVALFKRACTVNGFVCTLKIGKILKVEQVSPTTMQFTLTLQNPDGSLFELGACCGADPATSPPQTEFVYSVASMDGLFKILELPVFVP